MLIAFQFRFDAVSISFLLPSPMGGIHLRELGFFLIPENPLDEGNSSSTDNRVVRPPGTGAAENAQESFSTPFASEILVPSDGKLGKSSHACLLVLP